MTLTLFACYGFLPYAGQFSQTHLDSLKEEFSKAAQDCSWEDLAYQVTFAYRFSNIDSSYEVN